MLLVTRNEVKTKQRYEINLKKRNNCLLLVNVQVLDRIIEEIVSMMFDT